MLSEKKDTSKCHYKIFQYGITILDLLIVNLKYWNYEIIFPRLQSSEISEFRNACSNWHGIQGFMQWHGGSRHVAKECCTKYIRPL